MVCYFEQASPFVSEVRHFAFALSAMTVVAVANAIVLSWLDVAADLDLTVVAAMKFDVPVVVVELEEDDVVQLFHSQK